MVEKKFDIQKFKDEHMVDQRKMILDMPSTGLEPTYYWLTDYLQNVQRYNERVQKNDEAFAATVVSSFFSELGAKKTRMEQRAKEIMIDINTVIKSILNLVYDLKEFDRRLEIFDDINGLDKEKKEAAETAIKSVWMDEVDVKRGIGSINQLTTSGKLEFVTLRDAFLQAKDVKDVDKLDLNDRVKRIVGSRIEEYKKWRKRYEQDLRSRKKIEKLYLKAQVRTLKEYTTWARPYLMAAQKLRMSEKVEKDNEVDLMSYFDTSTITVSVRGCKKVKAESYFKHLRYGRSQMGKKTGRIREPSDPIYSTIELEFTFSSKPILVSKEGGPHYRHMGMIIVNFGAYVYSGSELDQLEEAEKKESMELVSTLDEMTKGSLEAIADDLEIYLNDKDEKKKFEFKPLGGILEPFDNAINGFIEIFKPLLSFLPKKGEGKKNVKVSRRDKWVIKLLKEQAREDVLEDIYKLFKIYRKAHGYVTFRG